jgi:hypothetical protein
MSNHKNLAIILLGIIALLALVLAEAAAQSQATSATPKTASETYKNIQVLKDAPAEQLVPAMQFITASLGVGCDHCHIQGAFDKDDKQAKQTARKMMQMTFAINQNNFGGHQEVTCFSCHRGGAKPIAVPIIEEEVASGSPAAAASSGSPADLPSANKLIEKYIQALGGADALKKMSSRLENGKASPLAGREFLIEVISKAPDKGISITHLPDGDLAVAYNAHGGWQLTPGRPLRELSSSEVDAARIDSNFYFPLHLQELFSGFETAGSDKLEGHAVFVVAGKRLNLPAVKLYFDQETGLLLRQIRYEQTPLGRNPVQSDFSDYRDAGGAKVPYRRITSRPGRRLVIQIDSVEQNVRIEDSKFEKPAGQTTPGQQAPK